MRFEIMVEESENTNLGFEIAGTLLWVLGAMLTWIAWNKQRYLEYEQQRAAAAYGTHTRVVACVALSSVACIRIVFKSSCSSTITSTTTVYAAFRAAKKQRVS